ncbi:unnamed protein product [Hydatigera taeniaeformis]|uniref:SET domain-containing protein n=1 Tax=Hydatigena taeniaeformis TaxID=6205 RepID=A0A0R3X9X8_HYDTA|nr:unnamed protein product [Hydatigera taeniaeformis]
MCIGPLKGEVALSFKVEGKPVTMTAVIPSPSSAVETGFPSSQRLLHRYTASLQITELLDRYSATGSDEDRASIVDLPSKCSPILVDRSLSLRPPFDTVVEEPESDIILKIAELQLFSGAWTRSPELTKALSLPSAKMDSVPTQFIGFHEDIWTTALVLAFLRLKTIKQQTEWQLLAKKAHDWLRKVMDEATANQAIEVACQTIGGTT